MTLAGATFQLWTDVDKDGKFTKDVDTVIPETLTDPTGADGKASWTGLTWGYYLVQEVTPPTGYTLSDPAIQAAVLDANTLLVKLTFENPRKPGSIEVIKVDKDSKVTLAGATFQLWTDVDKDGKFTKDVDTVIPETLTDPTGADGKASWTGLTWGYYLVQEVTPPTGYTLSDPAIQAAVLDANTLLVKLTFENPASPGRSRSSRRTTPGPTWPA